MESSATRGVTARRRVIDRRARLMAALVAALALGFFLLALALRRAPGTGVDLAITLAVQRVPIPAFGGLMAAVTALGFWPWDWLILGVAVAGFWLAGFYRAALFLLGRRLEALLTFVAAAGSAGLWYLLNPLVGRPRPSPELVDVAMQIPAGSFPSGHVLNLTAIFGFLIFLTILHLPGRRLTLLAVALLALPILTVGFARVADGAHWPSDVLGGYMAGGLWLALSIHLYRRARQWLAARRGGRAGQAVVGRLDAAGDRAHAAS